MSGEHPPLHRALGFGARTAVAGMLALYIAFVLQIDEPGWAATSAVIVAQPVLGASLRKGSYRLLGTLIGAVFAVLLYVAFPQSRTGFLIGLAAWGAGCSFVATYLRDFSAYAAMLAGFTAAIVSMDAVADPGSVFILAVARGSAIAIGIVCTTVVFSVSDRGRQRELLAERIDAIAAAVLAGLRELIEGEPEPMDRQRDRRRALLVAVAGLDTVLDRAIGENYDLRRRAGSLRAALGGLFAALSGWRGIEQQVRNLRPGRRVDTSDVARSLRGLPPDAAGARDAAAALQARPATDVARRVLLDQVSESLSGLAAAREGLTLLRDPLHAAAVDRADALQVSDWVSAAVNAVRTFVIVLLAGLVWILTAWSSGPMFVIFAMIVAMLYVLLEEAAFAGAAMMVAGYAVALVAAGVANFVFLPLIQNWGLDGYGAFAVVVGGVLAIAASIAAVPRPGSLIGALAFASMANFMPLLSPSNVQTYDYAGFLNGAMAILGGACLGAAGYRWLPPLSAAQRIRRTLTATRRDLARLQHGALRVDEGAWLRRLYLRLAQMPPEASLQQHARILAGLAVGRGVLRLRRLQAVPEPSSADRMRIEAIATEIAQAVASHPDYLTGLAG